MAGWEEVRVFISSTFLDMHSERDWLVKRVFPQLRTRLEPYRIRLVDIDLRWGITEEEQQNDRVLDLCLNQIDSCRPFFIGILGERYGWVPQSFNDASVSKYGWIQHLTGKSVTELEILYGVLNRPEMRASSFFYFRSPAFIDEVPPAKREDLSAENDAAVGKLRNLKQAIRGANLPTRPFEDYPCTYVGLRINWRLAAMLLDEDSREALHAVAADGLIDPHEYAALDERLRAFLHTHGTVELGGLEPFGNRVYDDIWAAIWAKHGLADAPALSVPSESDLLTEGQGVLSRLLKTLGSPRPRRGGGGRLNRKPFEDENLLHLQFSEQRSRIVIGRDNALQQLCDAIDVEDASVIVVTGRAGTGKSALMARFALDYQAHHPDVAGNLLREGKLSLVEASHVQFPSDIIVPHFVGASPASTSLRAMLRRFCMAIRDRFDVDGDVPIETNDLVVRFHEFILQIPEPQRVIFVIDAVNQLDETDDAHSLQWLPREWPRNVKCIVSCIAREDTDEPVLEVLSRHSTHIIRLEDLSDEDCLQILDKVPSVSAKRLSPVQIARLMNNQATRNPLFLLVALEELRGFGSFGLLDRRIDGLPKEGDTVTAIFGQVIDRLEEEFDAKIVRIVLECFACARGGVSETELIELVEGIGTETSSTDLFPILRQIRSYLQYRGEHLDFHHRSFHKAVRQRYFEPQPRLCSASSPQHAGWPSAPLNGTAECAAHRRLADYFRAKTQVTNGQTYSIDYTRGIRDLVFHQIHSGCSDSAEDTLLTYSFLEAKTKALGPLALVEDYDLLDPGRSSVPGIVQRAIRLATHVLANDPQQLPSQLHARLVDNKDPDVNRLLEGASKTQVKPWLRALRTCATPPGGAQVRTIQEYGGLVNAVTVSPDGKIAVSASRDRTLKIWSIATGRLLRTLKGHEMEVLSVAITPDGRTLVSASCDRTLKVWDLETGDKLHNLVGHDSRVTSVAITPDSTRVVSASLDKTLKVWDLASGDMLHSLESHRLSVESVVISSDGAQAISASSDGRVIAWDLAGGTVARTVYDGPDQLRRATVAPDGRRIIILSEQDKSIRIRDFYTGDLLQTLTGHTLDIQCVAITPDGKQVISGSHDNNVLVWNLDSGAHVGTLSGHSSVVSSVAACPDSAHVLSASWDGTLILWDTESLADQPSIPGHALEVKTIQIAPNSNRAISVGGDNTLKVWDLDRSEETLVLRVDKERKTSHACVTPDCTRAVCINSEKKLTKWDLVTGTELYSKNHPVSFVRSMAVSPEANLIIHALDSVVIFEDLNQEREPSRQYVHTDFVDFVGFSPDGSLALSGSRDKTVKVWDVSTREVVHSLEGHPMWVSFAKITTDNSRAITLAAKTLKVWDLGSGRELHTLDGHVDYIEWVEIMPDEKRVISASADTTLKVWDLDNGEHRLTLRGHAERVECVAVSPDGERAVSASEDKTIRIWALQSGECLATFKGDSSVRLCAFSNDGHNVVAGDKAGVVYFLRLEGLG